MKKHLAMAALAALMIAAPAAKADGCTVILCLAGNWKNISVCVPPVMQALRQMALGGSFPSCAMGSSSASSANGQTTAGNATPDQSTCPAMYSVYSEENNNWTGCQYTGMITISINGQAWSTTYWNTGGTTSTWYSDAARAGLASQIDPTYDNDLAAWNAAQAAAAAQNPQTGGGGG